MQSCGPQKLSLRPLLIRWTDIHPFFISVVQDSKKRYLYVHPILSVTALKLKATIPGQYLNPTASQLESFEDATYSDDSASDSSEPSRKKYKKKPKTKKSKKARAGDFKRGTT